MGLLGRKRAGQPVPARGEHVPGELDEPTASEAPVGLQRQGEPVPRPELRPEDAECQVRIRQKAVEQAPPGGAVTRGVSVELLRVRVRAPE